MGTVKIQLAVETADGRMVRTSIEIDSANDTPAQTQAAVAGALSAILQPASPVGATLAVAPPSTNNHKDGAPVGLMIERVDGSAITVTGAAIGTGASPAPTSIPPVGATLAVAPPSTNNHKDGAPVGPMVEKADDPAEPQAVMATGTGASPAPTVKRRDWSKYSVGFGIVLVLMALGVAAIFPPLVPPKQRIEVFMMSFAFGLLGTLSLFSGAMPRKDGTVATANLNPLPKPQAIPKPTSTSITTPSAQAARDALLRRTQGGRLNSATVWGLAFGALFVVAGVSAPFLFPNTGPDERFLMMLGFAPVVVIGIILMAVFWRRMRPHQAKPAFANAALSSPSAPSAPRPARAPVARAPNDAAFKLGVPAALAAIGVILVVVLVLVIVATIVPLFTR